ncbi:MAG TPA: phage holin family protein [Verrucomicrobiae bacterium]|nr:phage holin family protein [Verrucomicrobiae bacterium]
MMVGTNHKIPSLSTLIGRVGRVALKGVQNRVELLAVELQEERLRLAELLMKAIGLVLLTIMGVLLLTATIIFLFPADLRIYVTGILALLYLFAAAGVWAGLKNGLKREPFSETIEQVKKDRLWLESQK